MKLKYRILLILLIIVYNYSKDDKHSILLAKLNVNNDCYCELDSFLIDRINCDTIYFDNNAKLYWSFNCDSSWLTFENSKHKKDIIFSLGEGLQDYTGRLGYSYVQEYKNTFLIQNDVISGCCTPPDFLLFDKLTGKEKENLGKIIFIVSDKNLPLIISLTNSSYDSTKKEDFDGNSLTIYNIDKQKKYFFDLPIGEIDKICKENNILYPEELFVEPELIGTLLKLSYDLRIENKDSMRTIEIDLKNYLK